MMTGPCSRLRCLLRRTVAGQRWRPRLPPSGPASRRVRPTISQRCRATRIHRPRRQLRCRPSATRRRRPRQSTPRRRRPTSTAPIGQGLPRTRWHQLGPMHPIAARARGYGARQPRQRRLDRQGGTLQNILCHALVRPPRAHPPGCASDASLKASLSPSRPGRPSAGWGRRRRRRERSACLGEECRRCCHPRPPPQAKGISGAWHVLGRPIRASGKCAHRGCSALLGLCINKKLPRKDRVVPALVRPTRSGTGRRPILWHGTDVPFLEGRRGRAGAPVPVPRPDCRPAALRRGRAHAQAG